MADALDIQLVQSSSKNLNSNLKQYYARKDIDSDNKSEVSDEKPNKSHLPFVSRQDGS